MVISDRATKTSASSRTMTVYRAVKWSIPDEINKPHTITNAIQA